MAPKDYKLEEKKEKKRREKFPHRASLGKRRQKCYKKILCHWSNRRVIPFLLEGACANVDSTYLDCYGDDCPNDTYRIRTVWRWEVIGYGSLLREERVALSEPQDRAGNDGESGGHRAQERRRAVHLPRSEWAQHSVRRWQSKIKRAWCSLTSTAGYRHSSHSVPAQKFRSYFRYCLPASAISSSSRFQPSPFCCIVALLVQYAMSNILVLYRKMQCIYGFQCHKIHPSSSICRTSLSVLMYFS